MRRLELGLTLSCKNQLKKSNVISRLQMISYQDSKKALTTVDGLCLPNTRCI